ncbi:hypothetical protein K1X76_00745 [bacterium]|nr:hypothetical protein [bacterium]
MTEKELERLEKAFKIPEDDSPPELIVARLKKHARSKNRLSSGSMASFIKQHSVLFAVGVAACLLVMVYAIPQYKEIFDHSMKKAVIISPADIPLTAAKNDRATNTSNNIGSVIAEITAPSQNTLCLSSLQSLPLHNVSVFVGKNNIWSGTLEQQSIKTIKFDVHQDSSIRINWVYNNQTFEQDAGYLTPNTYQGHKIIILDNNKISYDRDDNCR